MKNLVIGTAGHIDHGKTTLIKHLTGTDTDTLPEEAQRGMTINLGFTYFKLSTGEKIGIVDVPGHEKFIKNMVAGATGLDFILFVIACDDGIMPQTIEHGNIVELLNINKGLIVLTKRDLATKERVEEIKKDIKETFAHSVIGQFPTVEVSSKDESSYENMKKILERELITINKRKREANFFKMAIDRVFSVKGFGTVVTGTSAQGVIHKGDTLMVYPQMLEVKVKGIENHGNKVDILEAGHRCALNLAGVETSDLKRGNLLAPEKALFVTSKIDCFFSLLPGKKEIKNNHRVRLHMGTIEVIGRIKLLGRDILEPGENSLIQLELEKSIVCNMGDIGVIRNYSPMDTIGGIKIISPQGENTKRYDENYIDRLKSLQGNDDDKISASLKKFNNSLATLEDISISLGKYISLDSLKSNSDILIFQDGENYKFFHKSNFLILKDKLYNYLENFHKENNLKKGASRSEIRNKIFQGFTLRDYNLFISLLENDLIGITEEAIFLKDFTIKLNKEQKLLKDEILKLYKVAEFSPETLKDISNNFLDKDNFYTMHNYLKEKELLIPLNKETYVLKGFFQESKNRLLDYANKNEKITLGEFKNVLGVSRKFALIFLEKFDEIGFTKRIDDYRVLRKENL
ncbi:MAG: selenocysteine-specific translation elongation factor [Cetobacterium sp.]